MTIKRYLVILEVDTSKPSSYTDTNSRMYLREEVRRELEDLFENGYNFKISFTPIYEMKELPDVQTVE